MKNSRKQDQAVDEEEFFFKTISKQRIKLYDGKIWQLYRAGSKTSEIPLILIPGTCGTASVFHHQVMDLSEKGFDVIAIHHPVVWTHNEWIHSFDRLLDQLKLPIVHLYGVSLGGFLAQLYCSYFPKRVRSLALSNSFCNTDLFRTNAPCIQLLRLAPEVALKQYILQYFPKDRGNSKPVSDSITYMLDQLKQLNQEELASRLTLNSLSCSLATSSIGIPETRITLIDTYGLTSLPTELQKEMTTKYPNAKRAYIKATGDFPYLSHPDQVSLHLHVSQDNLIK